MKFVLGLLCLVACAFVTISCLNATWGKRASRDVLIFRKPVIRGAVRNNYVSDVVYFPESGYGNTRNITLISVIDNFRNKSGATPSLWSGGPRYKFAQINLRSQYGYGINSTVEIYGL